MTDDASTWEISNENNSRGASQASPPRIFLTPSLNTPVSTRCHSAETEKKKKKLTLYLNTRLQPMGGAHRTNKSDSSTWIDSNFEFTSRFEDCSHNMKSKTCVFENGSDWYLIIAFFFRHVPLILLTSIIYYIFYILCRVTLTVYSIIHRCVLCIMCWLYLIWICCDVISYVIYHAESWVCPMQTETSVCKWFYILKHSSSQKAHVCVCLQVSGPSKAAWNQMAVRQTSGKQC